MDDDLFDTSSSQARAYRSSNKGTSRSLNFTNSEELAKDLSDTRENYHDLHQDPMERGMALLDDDDDHGFFVPKARRLRSLNQVGHPDMSIREMQLRLTHLESQLTVSTNDDENVKGVRVGILQDDSAEAGDPATVVITNGVRSEQFVSANIIPEITERTWQEFMNKNADDDTDFAIEVMKGEPSYYTLAKNTDKLDKIEAQVTKSKETNLVTDTLKRALHTSTSPSENQIRVPDRIRINSQFILKTLSEIDRYLEASGPVVIFRPYKSLLHNWNRIKVAVASFQTQLQRLNAESEEAEVIETTLQHMLCLVNFMDIYVNPTVERLKDDSARKVAFRDLWYLFPPGENIFMPLKRLRGSTFRDAMDATPETFLRRYNMLWRVTGSGGGRPNLNKSHGHEDTLKPDPFKINCYYVDFDGKFFLPTVHTFALLPFVGEREITSLDFYPVRFMKGGQEKLLDHTELGKETFRTIATGFTHFYYSGLTMVTQPCGCPLQEEPMHQEYIESEVIVDFKAALLRNPSWRPKPTFWKPPPREEGEVQERCPVRYWKDKAHKHLEHREHDYIYDDYYIDRELALVFRSNEQIFSPIPSGWASNAEMVPQKDVGLLAGRAFAFVLRTRSFAPLWLWALQPIRSQSDSLNNLQLRDDTFKDTIFALVQSHFRQISQHASDFEYDVVRGKGKGLIMLLHGAPGVGKTSTAESVAAKSGRPLFQITCGDLGLTPSEVEKNLKEIFRFSQLWGCVLLLDECDIFLAQRSKNDIKRNGLVSVFLRTLEFFTGVLFLTTNRVGVLDDAIKSRLTWTAYYPPLDERQTMKIWKVNLKLLRERNPNLDIDNRGILRFALEHFRTCATTESTWNGRQIQNAFKVATALAEWDLHSQDDQLIEDIGSLDGLKENRPKLTAAQFRVIAQGTQAFDDYLREATGLTEKERAYNAMERADDFDPQDNVAESQILDEPRYTRQPQQSPVLSHRRGSMSTLLPQQIADRAPASPHALAPIGRRKSSTKWPQHPSPSTSTGNLVGGLHQNRTRRASSTLTTVYPSIDMQAHSPQSNGWHGKRMPGGHRNSTDYGLTREISHDDDLQFELNEDAELKNGGIGTSTSSLEGYGDDT